MQQESVKIFECLDVMITYGISAGYWRKEAYFRNEDN